MENEVERIRELEEQLYKASEEKYLLQETVERLQDQLDDYEYELDSVETYKKLYEKSMDELADLAEKLEEAKSENRSLQFSVNSLQRQLEYSEKGYAELAQRKHELELKKHQHDDAFWSSLYFGAPFGGLAIVLLASLCRLLGLFEGFFQRFSENAEIIALCACGAVVSYVSIRIYYWKKNEKNRR